MQSKSAELQQQINELDQLIQQGAADAQLNLWEMQRKDLNDQLQVALQEEASQQERVQAQAEKIQSITLPFDYNEILGNSLANETIIENVKQFQQQAYEEHNVMVDQINAGWKNRLDELTNEWALVKTQLQTVNGELQTKLDAENEQAQKDAIELNALTQQVAQLGLELNQSRNDNDDLRTQVTQLNLERNDLFNKRDAAANALIEANRQIEILKTPPSPSSSIISVNDHLADLATRAKQNTINQINKNLARFEIPALNIPTLPEANIEHVTEVVEPVKEIPFQTETEVHSAESGLVDQSQSVPGEGLEEKSEVITLESLHEYVKNEFKDVWTHIHLGLIGGKKEDAA